MVAAQSHFYKVTKQAVGSYILHPTSSHHTSMLTAALAQGHPYCTLLDIFEAVEDKCCDLEDRKAAIVGSVYLLDRLFRVRLNGLELPESIPLVKSLLGSENFVKPSLEYRIEVSLLELEGDLNFSNLSLPHLFSAATFPVGTGTGIVQTGPFSFMRHTVPSKVLNLSTGPPTNLAGLVRKATQTPYLLDAWVLVIGSIILLQSPGLLKSSEGDVLQVGLPKLRTALFSTTQAGLKRAWEEDTQDSSYLLQNELKMWERSPLHYAVFLNQISAIKELSSTYSQVDLPDCDGLTPLRAAVLLQQVDTVKHLLSIEEHDLTSVYKEETYLTAAVLSQNPYIVSLLLANGADPAQMSLSDLTPKEIAEELGDKEISALFN